MPWARASALHRHLECPASAHLPRWERDAWRPGYLHTGPFTPPSDLEPEDKRAADWGTAMHLAQSDPALSCEPFLSYLEPYRHYWPDHLGRHEVAVSYDCRTEHVAVFPGETEAQRDAWKASRGEDCVVGTCDWWAELPTGDPWVDDLKTGWRKPEVVTAQLLFYALCKSAKSVTLSITHWPRGTQRPIRYWERVGPLDLEQFRNDLRKAWLKAVSAADPRPGPHCQYCPSVSVCPRNAE